MPNALLPRANGDATQAPPPTSSRFDLQGPRQYLLLKTGDGPGACAASEIIDRRGVVRNHALVLANPQLSVHNKPSTTAMVSMEPLSRVRDASAGNRQISIGLRVEAAALPRAPLTAAEIAAVLQFAARLDIDAVFGSHHKSQQQQRGSIADASNEVANKGDSTATSPASNGTVPPFARARGFNPSIVLEACRDFDLRSLDAQVQTIVDSDAELSQLRATRRALVWARKGIDIRPSQFIGS